MAYDPLPDFLDYNERAVCVGRMQRPHYHSTACLSARVDAFCDDVPDPGCTCGGEARVKAANSRIIERARERAAQEREAALDAAEFNDPREQERLQHEADLRYEYSKPEYD